MELSCSMTSKPLGRGHGWPFLQSSSNQGRAMMRSQQLGETNKTSDAPRPLPRADAIVILRIIRGLYMQKPRSSTQLRRYVPPPPSRAAALHCSQHSIAFQCLDERTQDSCAISPLECVGQRLDSHRRRVYLALLRAVAYPCQIAVLDSRVLF